MNEPPNAFYILLWIFCILIAGGLLVFAVLNLISFARELKYLNREIARSTGHERQYWLRCRRRLWLSLLPFVKY